MRNDSGEQSGGFDKLNGRDKPRIRWRLVGLGILYLLVEFYILLLLPFWLPILQISGTNVDWSNGFYGIGFSALLIALYPWLRQNVGLRWKQAPGSLPWSIITFFIFSGFSVTMGYLYLEPRKLALETLLIQGAITPVGEELAFRGITLALLERAFGKSPMDCRMRFGWAALVTSLIFGLGHGWYRVDAVLVGSALALVRIRSGSLLWPMLCHAGINMPFYLVAMLKYRGQ